MRGRVNDVTNAKEKKTVVCDKRKESNDVSGDGTRTLAALVAQGKYERNRCPRLTYGREARCPRVHFSFSTGSVGSSVP